MWEVTVIAVRFFSFVIASDAISAWSAARRRDHEYRMAQLDVCECDEEEEARDADA